MVRLSWLFAVGAPLYALPFALMPGQGVAQSPIAAENTQVDAPDFGFDLIIVEDPPLAAASPSERPALGASLPPSAGNSNGSLTLQRLSVTELVATGRSPFIPDQPIEWAVVLTPSRRLPDLREGLLRIPGQDVTPPGLDLPDMEPAAIARALQTELQRLGCYRGAIDGAFGPRSRAALDEYLTRTGQTADGRDPTLALLAMTQASEGRICPAPPPAPVARAQPSQPQAPSQPAAPPPAEAQSQARTSPSRLESVIRSFR